MTIFSSFPSLRLNNSAFDAVSPHEYLQRNGESGVSESDDEINFCTDVLTGPGFDTSK